MGDVVRLPNAVVDDEDDFEAEHALVELSRLLDSPPQLLQRSAHVINGTAYPAHDLLKPIIRRLRSPVAMWVAIVMAGLMILLFAGPDPSDVLVGPWL